MRNRAKRRTWTLMISKNDIRAAVGLAFLLIVQIQAARISFAEELPPSLYSEMEWRMIGPFRAGKVNGVDHSPLHFRIRSEEHTSELQSRFDLVCRLLLEKKKAKT